MDYHSRYRSDYGYAPSYRSGYYGSWMSEPLDLPPLAKEDDQPSAELLSRPSWFTRLIDWLVDGCLLAAQHASPERRS